MYETKGFIFDMDGTLVDNMRFHTEAWQRLLFENNLTMDSDEFLVKTAGRTNREILPAIFGELSEARLATLGGRKEELYREFYLPHRKTVAGVTAFLRSAQALGLRMAVATAAPKENLDYILDGLQLRNFFHASVTADDVTHGKPHPEIFLKSAEKLQVTPSHCLVFEDAINGVKAADRAGMKSIAITTVNDAATLGPLPSVVQVIQNFLEIEPTELVKKFL